MSSHHSENFRRLAEDRMLYGDTLGAIDYLKQGLSLDPNDALLHAYLAINLLELKRVHAAKHEADIALELNPEFSFNHFVKGKILIAERKLHKALEAFQTALGFDPTFIEAMIGEAQVYQLLKQPNDALTVLEKARSIAPDSSDVHAEIGDHYLHKDDILQAEKHYRQALELEPSHAQSLCGMGHIHLRQGRIGEARDHAIWVLQNNSTHLAALNLITGIKMKENKFLGLWWNFNTWLSKGGTLRMISLLLSLFALQRLATLITRDLNYPQASEIISLLWIGFVIYTWVGPAMFKKALQKEIGEVQLKEGF